ncbi:MAG: glycosyltransferase family 4 protein [Bacteroidales bacterium]|nr:glycosyltransferase family 4 protein [Bacteroidales bacterium]
MKILINGLQLGNLNTGVQYYTENLLHEYQKQNKHFDFLVSKNYKNNFSANDLINIHFINLKESRVRRIFYENFMLPKYFLNQKFDLYHSPNYLLPFRCPFPSVVTIHDLITLDYPELCQTESVFYFRLFLPRSIKKVSKIIAVSHKVKEDIIRHFKTPPEKIEVVYHGISSNFKKITDPELLSNVIRKYRLPEQFILFVGNIEPKKNLERLVAAFCKLKKETLIKHKLVIVGKKGWKYRHVFDIVKKSRLENEVLFPGYVPKEELPCFYSLADLFAFPSLYEGFGFPPLEAMACGLPALVSDRGALPEITGGKCLQVDPYDVNQLAEGMYQLITNTGLKQKLISEGREWVKQFTWERAAKETVCVYKTILGC